MFPSSVDRHKFNSQVIETGPPPEGGVLGGTIPRRKRMPLTAAEEDVQEALAAGSGNTDDMMIITEPKFSIAGVNRPKAEIVTLPVNRDRMLLNPKERRMQMEYEKMERAAKHKTRRARNERARLHDMVGNESRTAANPATTQKSNDRRVNLSAKTTSEIIRGYDFLSHESQGNGHIQKVFQAKGRTGPTQSFLETHNRVFKPNEAMKVNKERQEYLKFQDTRGLPSILYHN